MGMIIKLSIKWAHGIAGKGMMTRIVQPVLISKLPSPRPVTRCKCRCASPGGIITYETKISCIITQCVAGGILTDIGVSSHVVHETNTRHPEIRRSAQLGQHIIGEFAKTRC